MLIFAEAVRTPVCEQEYGRNPIVTTKRGTAINILVVDDEPFIRNLIVRILDKLGYENIDTSSNGKEALGKLISEETAYDVIICDLNMPEMDGVEFMRHAKESDFTGGMILLSGEDNRLLETALDLATSQNLNVLGALPKPVKPDLLEELLNKYKPSVQEKRDFVPQAAISEAELRAGIEGSDSGELMLVYQPKVHMQSGEITGVETLARWKHPERGILGPGAFIPLAEKTGLIDALTHQIYRKAVQQTSDWLLDGIRLRTSVNFSINSFADSNFSDFIISTTEEAGVDPKQLILEVTETQVMTNSFDCLEILMGMRFKKFGLSIDDFGTGNSSMAQLKRIPFTELKVDRAFVHGAVNNTGARAILEASVTLAKNLDMKIVAEGAETREDWDLVEQLGVDYVQGYYCAKPMPNEQLLEFMEKWNGPH